MAQGHWQGRSLLPEIRNYFLAWGMQQLIIMPPAIIMTGMPIFIIELMWLQHSVIISLLMEDIGDILQTMASPDISQVMVHIIIGIIIGIIPPIICIGIMDICGIMGICGIIFMPPIFIIGIAFIINNSFNILFNKLRHLFSKGKEARHLYYSFLNFSGLLPRRRFNPTKVNYQLKNV
jgi:hypothetical protein